MTGIKLLEITMIKYAIISFPEQNFVGYNEHNTAVLTSYFCSGSFFSKVHMGK